MEVLVFDSSKIMLLYSHGIAQADWTVHISGGSKWYSCDSSITCAHCVLYLAFMYIMASVQDIKITSHTMLAYYVMKRV